MSYSPLHTKGLTVITILVVLLTCRFSWLQRLLYISFSRSTQSKLLVSLDPLKVSYQSVLDLHHPNQSLLNAIYDCVSFPHTLASMLLAPCSWLIFLPRASLSPSFVLGMFARFPWPPVLSYGYDYGYGSLVEISSGGRMSRWMNRWMDRDR